MANTKVTSRVLADDAVLTANIADDAVTSAKLDTNITVAGTLASTGALTANAGVVVDNITIDGTEIDLSSGDLLVDVAGDIYLDAAGAEIYFSASGGTGSTVGYLSMAANNLTLKSGVSDADIIFKGNDGGSEITALTLDMSAAGAATFNGAVTIGGDLTVSGTTTTLNTATLDVEDKNITLNKGSGDTSGSANGAGITIQDAVDASNDATLLWDASNDEFDFSHKVTAPALTVDDITIDGSTISDSGDITIDSGANITLDADGGAIGLNDGGTHYASFENSSNSLYIETKISDKDIILRGNDGGSTITALTLDMSDAGKATFNNGIVSNAGVVVDNITIDGTEIDLSSGDLTLDVAGDIILDADGADFKFRDAGSGFFTISNSSSDTELRVETADKDILFKGTDSSTAVTALTLDMSEGGKALFSSSVQAQIAGFYLTENTTDAFSIASNGANGFLKIRDEYNSADRITILNDGKVGIGTASPAEALDVSGNALLSGSDGTIRKLTFGATGGNHGSIGVDASGHTFVDVETAGGVLYGKIGGNERLKLQDSGPVMTITEAGTDGYETLLKLYRSSASANEVGMQFDLSGSGGAAQAVGMWAAKGEDWSSGTSRSATLNFQAKDDGTDQNMYQFGNFSDGVNQHKFLTEGAERMRIDQNGIVMVGDTAGYSGGHDAVSRMQLTGGGSVLGIRQSQVTDASHRVVAVFTDNGGTYRGRITINNSACSFTSASDYRLKENIETLPNGLDRLKQLKPVKFKWKEHDYTSEGFIAHEVQEIYPDAVVGAKDDAVMQSMDYGKITPLLVKAIQEQQTIIDDLKARIETLEG